MASSRLVLAHRSLSRRTSGESYRCWTGTGEAKGRVTFSHKRQREEEEEEIEKGNGGKVIKAKQATQHRESITSREWRFGAVLWSKGLLFYGTSKQWFSEWGEECRQIKANIKAAMSQLRYATALLGHSNEAVNWKGENFRYTWWKINRVRLIKNNMCLMKAVLAAKCCHAPIVQVFLFSYCSTRIAESFLLFTGPG